MFLPKIILTAVLICAAAFAAAAQETDAKNWSIADYFKNLPEKYITAAGDFPEPTAETLVVDWKNGYAAAYVTFPPRSAMNDEEFPTFETALFKSQNKSPLLVVSNLKRDSVCSDYETFFLRYDRKVWTEVRKDVLPPLALKMFWDKPQSAARFAKIVERDNAATFHFEPPRAGTRMKVSLEICDYFLEVTPLKDVDELTKIIETTKPIYLEWDKQSGKFKLAK